MQENCPQIPVRNSVELGVALDDHKFSKDSCGEMVYKFQKGFIVDTHTSSYMHTAYK